MKINTPSLLQRQVRSFKSFVRAIGKIVAPAPRETPTNCVNINSLLMHLCDFDQLTYRYVLKWLAYPIQNPGAKMQRALVFNGPQGTGTSLFFDRVVAALYGAQGHHVSSHQVMHGHLKDWAAEARMVVIEGDYSARLSAQLKALVSSQFIYIDQEGKRRRIPPNRTNFIFLSDSADLLPLSACDRRFFIVEAPPARERLFYIAVAEEIENGGVEAFFDYLKSAVDLTGFNEFSGPPMAVKNPQLEFA